MALQLQVDIAPRAIEQENDSGFLFSAGLAAHLYRDHEELQFLNIATPQFQRSIPLIVKNGLPGKRIVMPQYMPYFSLDFPQDESLSTARQTSVARHISTSIAETISAEKPILAELNFLPFYWLPFQWQGFEVKPRITYRLETFHTTTESLINGFRDNIRRQIRKSEKQNAVSTAETSQTLFDLNRDSYQRKGDDHPFDPAILERLHQFLNKNHCGEILEIRDASGETIAAALFAWDQNRLYYLTGGVRESDKSSGAMAHVLWEGIQLAHSKALCFDFEGSMNPGIEKFFSTFGGTPYTYFQVRKSNSKLYKLYQNLRS